MAVDLSRGNRLELPSSWAGSMIPTPFNGVICAALKPLPMVHQFERTERWVGISDEE
jgi:hypothetical protein